jgi:hypothetical protein
MKRHWLYGYKFKPTIPNFFYALNIFVCEGVWQNFSIELLGKKKWNIYCFNFHLSLKFDNNWFSFTLSLILLYSLIKYAYVTINILCDDKFKYISFYPTLDNCNYVITLKT